MEKIEWNGEYYANFFEAKGEGLAGKSCGLGMMHGSMAFCLLAELAAIGIRFWGLLLVIASG